MALLPCSDCGHQVSDQAAACPQCGRPVVRQAPPPELAQRDVAAAAKQHSAVTPNVLVALPLAGAALIAMTPIPGTTVVFLVIVLSAFTIHAEARELGMISPRDSAGPIAWFFGTLLLYGFTVPFFLRKRRLRLGARSSAGFASIVCVTLLFLVNGYFR